MTTLLRTEYFIVGVNTQAVVLFALTIQFYTEIVLHIAFRHPTEGQRNLGIAFILQRKIKEKIIKTVLGAGIITPQGRELHPAEVGNAVLSTGPAVKSELYLSASR